MEDEAEGRGQRRVEQALGESEARLAATLDSIAEGVIATDLAGVVVQINPVAEQLSGWTSGEALGAPLGLVHRVLDEESRALAPDVVALVLRSGGPAGATRRLLVTPDGREIPIVRTAAPIRDQAGALLGVVVVFRDVSEERRATAAVERSHRELRRMIDELPDGILVRRGPRITYANQALARMLGYEHRDELIGASVADFVPADERDSALATLRQRDEAGARAPRREWRFVRRDGGTVTVEMSDGFRVELEGLPGLLLAVRDVTERRRLEAQLMQADRMVSIGTLAAGVAHEINNPLAYLIAGIEYATQELRALAPRLAPGQLTEVLEALAEAREGSDRVRHTVHDLRTFSRVDDEYFGPVDVRQVLESSIAMSFSEIKHRARLVKDYGPVPPVLGNRARLGQVFLNLLINAAHAISGPVQENEIRLVTSTDEAGRGVVEVRDTGSGIAPEHVGRIFDPFFTTKPVGQGTGLGLAICHSLVTALRGTIEVETKVGHGTRFRVVLPAAPADEVVAAGGPRPAAAGPRGRVLVVDDEPAVGLGVRRILAADHDVIAVTTAREALDRIMAGERFDLVLCDLMMPEMTGMELHAELTRMAPAIAARLVIITGGACTPAARAFLERVSTPRLEKPFEADALRALVRSLVR